METTTIFLQDQVAALTQLREKHEALIESLQKQITELSEKIGPNHQNCDYWKAENGRVQGQVIELIDSIYAGDEPDIEDVAKTLCEIVDYQPTKEIEFTATMRFTGRIDVPANEEVDLDMILQDAYVDINNGDVIIDNYELYDAEEC